MIGGVNRRQWSSHKDAGSSRYGSHPSSANRSPAGAVGRISPLNRRFSGSAGSITLKAAHQNRMDRTMFLPTPSHSMASGASNMPPSDRIPSYPFFNQP